MGIHGFLEWRMGSPCPTKNGLCHARCPPAERSRPAV
jgi:hypothetical protein